MGIFSRRKFLKIALSASALLNAACFFKLTEEKPKPREVVLTIDKDGNAKLHGIELVVDRRRNAIVTKGRND